MGWRRAQADRDGRADEFADAYAESELYAENARLMTSRPGMESRTSITTIQELAVTQGTVTPFWWGLWVLIKVRPRTHPSPCSILCRVRARALPAGQHLPILLAPERCAGLLKHTVDIIHLET